MQCIAGHGTDFRPELPLVVGSENDASRPHLPREFFARQSNNHVIATDPCDIGAKTILRRFAERPPALD